MIMTSPENHVLTTPPRMHAANVGPNNQVEAPPLVPAAKRRRFTIQEKLGLICAAQRLIDAGMSQRAACEELNIHHTMYGMWKKQFDAMVDRKKMRSKSLFWAVFLSGSKSRGVLAIHL